MTVWVAAAFALAGLFGASPEGPPRPRVTLGVDVLLSEQIDLVRGKRVGLVTNQSGVDGALVPTADRLARDPRVNLVQLYAPEHGLRGAERAGHKVDDARDTVTGVPIESLFAKRKAPSPETLARVDILLFDIQDIGSRTYTYTTTMALSMKAAKDAGVPFVVLDRPNPLGGLHFEGPIRERRYKSFVGWGPTPVSHGMTIGELAGFYNDALKIGCELHVVKMKGWRRDMVWGDTGLTWVPTSPGIPHALNAHLYVATGMIGGVSKNVNEGVGSTLPFETIAAEFIDPQRFAAELNRLQLPGVRFRPITYRPRYGRFDKRTQHGVQLLPYDLHAFRPLRTALEVATTLERLYPGRHRFRRARYVALIWGTDRVLTLIRAGKTAEEIERSWALDTAGFASRRAPYLIYP